MTLPLIIILSLALIALLVDWKKIAPKLPKIGRLPRPTRAVRAVPPAQPPTAPPSEPELPDTTGNAALDKLLAEADIHFRKSEMKAAENLYLQVAAQDPRCAKAYARLGVIYLENGDDWEDAEAAFRQALKSEPENGYVLNNLGLVLYHQDKFADAIRNFEHAVRQDELNASRHSNLGMAYMAMRQYAKAESSFKKALKLAPNEMEYKDLLAEAVEKKLAHKTMVRR
jgi:Tfp pilus assembly protein PilF